MNATSARQRRLRPLIACVAFLAALIVPIAASGAVTANTITSSNWSGYAAHGGGVRFRDATGSWQQPAVTCSTGTASYSSFWVGIGGYSLTSDALEQAGTETDCNSDGTYTLTAWYQLVPAPARTIKMKVEPGDRIIANVRVIGHRITVAMADTTRAEYFGRTITDHTVDDASAEWIAEAPSDCTTSGTCTALPLADFGNVKFDGARVQTTRDLVSAITNSRWTTTKLLLGYSRKNEALVAKTTTANATPSALTDAGRAFQVTFSGVTSTGTTTGTGTTPGPGVPWGAPGPAVAGAAAARHGDSRRARARRPTIHTRLRRSGSIVCFDQQRRSPVRCTHG
jgi:hypothetical protein